MFRSVLVLFVGLLLFNFSVAARKNVGKLRRSATKSTDDPYRDGLYNANDDSIAFDHPYSDRGEWKPGEEYAAYDDNNGGFPADDSKEDEDIDFVEQYTNSALKKTITALSSAIFTFFLSMLVLNYIFRTAINTLVPTAIAMASFVSCYLSKGKFSDLSKASGVFLMLILRRSRPVQFSRAFAAQAMSTVMLAPRRPFPSSPNPWKHTPSGPDDPVRSFSMMYVAASVSLMGLFVGWAVTSLIPFFPSFLGALCFSGFTFYLSTLADARGDILRFIGYTCLTCLGVLSEASGDVSLREKFTAIAGDLFAFADRVNKRYNVLPKLSAAFQLIVAALTKIILRIRSDIQQQRQD